MTRRPGIVLELMTACLLQWCGCSGALIAQTLSGNVEWTTRANDQTAGGLGSGMVPDLETALTLRLRLDTGPGGRRLTAQFDGYASAEADDAVNPEGWRGELNEAFASYAWSGCTASLGVRRYPDQYSYYWNPTFLPQPKVDLSRPDYLAKGISHAALGCRVGRLSPKILVAWSSEDAIPGAQLNGYFGQTEVYVNAFLGLESERTIGGGWRRGLGSWTVQAESCVVWNDQRWRPSPPQTLTVESVVPLQHPEEGVRGVVALGINRQAPGNGLFVMEVLYDGRGFSAAEFDRLLELMGRTGHLAEWRSGSAFTPGQPGELRRAYLHAALTQVGA